MIRTTLLLLLSFFLAAGFAHANIPDKPANPIDSIPRVVAALEQGAAAERGMGIRKNIPLAISFYCDAVTLGSPEGFYRIGRLLATGPRSIRNPRMANTYLGWAALLGHPQALKYRNKNIESAPISNCGDFAERHPMPSFNTNGYLATQTVSKQKIAAYIRKTAPQYGVDPRLALGIALAESNLNSRAISPKNAQGVMQLIPSTQKRFGVTQPFDPEQNVRGGLSYLRWLQQRFGGNWLLIAAAYNAGEEKVERYRGVPPFPETQRYVKRVLYFASTR